MNAAISGGSFLVSRSIYKSAVWTRHPQVLKLWLWLLGMAAFQDGGTFKGHALKRGEVITTYGEIFSALSYQFNRKLVTPTLKEVRIMLSWLQSEGMISVKPLIDGTLPNKGRHHDRTRAYVGLLISVVNYDPYQNVESYKGRDKGRPSSELGQTKDNNNVNNVKRAPGEILSEISDRLKRYPDQETITRVFQALSSTRKTNRLADSVKLNILQSWERHSVESVMEGIRSYLDKGYADQGKGEKYLLGIIRNSNGQDHTHNTGQAMKSTGSPLLDAYYQGKLSINQEASTP